MNDQVSAKSGYRPAQPPLPPLTSGMFLADPFDTNQLAPLVVLDRFAAGLHQILHEGDINVARSARGDEVIAWPTNSFVRTFDQVEPVGRYSKQNIQAFDAHFVLYNAISLETGLLEQLVPRLTKPGLYSYITEKKENAQGEDEFVPIRQAVGTYLALDYDLPKHGTDGGWTPARLEEVSKILHDVGERNPLFKYPTVLYRTRGGLRFVWALYEPIPIEGKHGLEDLLTGIVGDAYIAGLGVDPTCRDWTRLFRLPKVRRPSGDTEFENTWEAGYFSVSYNRVDLLAQDHCPSQVVVHGAERFRGISDHKREDYENSDLARDLLSVGKWAARVGKIPRSNTAIVEEVVVGDKPSNLDEHLETGTRHTPTLKAKLVKQRINGLMKRKNAWDAEDAGLTFRVLYENGLLFTNEAKKEGFHWGVMRVASFLTRHFTSVPNVDAQVIYALLLTAAFRSNALRTGSDKRSPQKLEKEVWDIVFYLWRNDASKKVVAAEEASEQIEFQEILRAAHVQSLEGIIKLATTQVMTWLPEQDQNLIRQYIKKWFIIQMPDGTRHVLKRMPNGALTYGPGVKGLPGLGCQIRDSGHDFVKIMRNDIDDGKAVSWKTEMDIMNEYGTTLFSRVLSRKVPMNQVRSVDKEGTVAFIEALPGFRTDIPAIEHEDVDQWLRLLGGSQAEKLLDWCAALTVLDQPIAALYLQKQTSAGKGMLGQAIIQMTKSRSYTPFEQVLGEFQDTMAGSPLVWADEETGASKFGMRTPMNTFKRLVTGEFGSLNSKGEKHVNIEGQWRVLITANTAEALKFTQDVNQNDMEAVKLRLLRVTPSLRAVEYLESLGGREGTANWPEKKIPEHIMWLAKTRTLTPGKRLLVEGSEPKEEEDENILGLNSTTGDTVLRALGKILQEKYDHVTGETIKEYKGAFKIDTVNSLFLVNSDSLHDWMIKLFQDDRSVKVPAVRNIGTSLCSISNNAQQVRGTRKDPRFYVGSVRLHQLPLHKVISTLDAQGLNCDFRGNGAIDDAYYATWLPALHKQMVSAAVLTSRPVNQLNGTTNGHANGHHPVPQTSNNPVRPMNWTALRPAPKTN